jgi:hypothetical protein
MLVFVTPVLVTPTPDLPELKEPEGIVRRPVPVKSELFRFEPVRLELAVPVMVVMPVLVL